MAGDSDAKFVDAYGAYLDSKVSVVDPGIVSFLRKGFLEEAHFWVHYGLRTPEYRLTEASKFRDDVLWFLDRTRGDYVGQLDWVCNSLSGAVHVNIDPDMFRASIADAVDGYHFGHHSMFVANKETGFVEVQHCHDGCLAKMVAEQESTNA